MSSAAALIGHTLAGRFRLTGFLGEGAMATVYRGEQDEEVFARRDDGTAEDHAELEVIARNHLKPGDFYELLPEVDIHRVKTTSDLTSVSLHLLGIDNGCIWRHRFLPEEERVVPFKSGYVNVPCEQDRDAAVS